MLLSRLRGLAADPGVGLSPVRSGRAGHFALPEPPLRDASARVVEDATLRAHDAGEPAGSGFGAFLDGVQRSAVAAYRGAVPIVHARAGAAVRVCGDDGRLRTGEWVREREALFFPFALVDPASLERAGVPRDALVDTHPGTEPPLFPPALYAAASERVNHWREDLERELAEAWIGARGEPLLVDGALSMSPAVAAAPTAVGVVKGHRTRFFDGDEARALYALRAGQRTSIFEPETRRFAPVRSWYLRLRDARDRDVTFGLVRVEAAAAHATPERADEVSRWLLAETAPLSLPDPRWDRLIYPIRECERYLRSRMPAA